MSAEGALNRLTADDGGAGPNPRRPQHDRRPARALVDAIGASVLLDGADLRIAVVERGGKALEDARRVVTLDKEDLAAVAGDHRCHILVLLAAQHGWAGDLVAVKVQD